MSYVIRAQREDDPEWYYVRMQGNIWTLTSIRDFATRWTTEHSARDAAQHSGIPQIKFGAKIEEVG